VQQRQTRGIGGQAQRIKGLKIEIPHRLEQLGAPVIEITCDDQRSAHGHLLRHILPQPLYLAFATGMNQSQVHHDHMQVLPFDKQLGMQQAALLEPVV
jgi:hypothetical protein